MSLPLSVLTSPVVCRSVWFLPLPVYAVMFTMFSPSPSLVTLLVSSRIARRLQVVDVDVKYIHLNSVKHILFLMFYSFLIYSKYYNIYSSSHDDAIFI